MTQLRVSLLAIVISLIVAIVFELLVLPDAFNQFRAEWVVLTIIYWLLRHPEKVGVFFAFSVGIILDVVSGSYIGVQALSCGIIAYLVLTIHQRLKMFPILQQSMVVFLIVGIQLMIVTVIRSNLGSAEHSFTYLWSALSSALVWPLVLIFTDRLSFALR